jgi:hypothetical protein
MTRRRKAEFIIGEFEAVIRDDKTYRRFDVTTKSEGIIGVLYLRNDVDLNPKRLLLREIDSWVSTVKMEGG